MPARNKSSRIHQCVMQALEARRLLAVATVSINNSNTATGNAATNDPPTSGAITDDGRFIVFVSGACNLVAGAHSANQVVRRDIVNSSSVLVSLASNGTSVGNGVSSEAWVSGDGRFVAFNSKSSN